MNCQCKDICNHDHHRTKKCPNEATTEYKDIYGKIVQVCSQCNPINKATNSLLRASYYSGLNKGFDLGLEISKNGYWN